MQKDAFPHVIFPENPTGSFENDELNVGVRVILQHHGRAGDRRSDRRGVDLSTARVLRDAQEHGATAELEVAGASVETEDRVGAEAGERLVGKGKFRA